jgi:cell division protein FtsZ
VERRTPLTEAFDIANSVLYGATRGISELITVPGLINVDFADVRTIMREMGDAVMGTGEATGENRGVEAAHMAISSPLLDDVSISGARGVLVNITGGSSMSLFEVDEATEIIHNAAGDEANVILGAVIDDKLTDEIIVTVIATGFNQKVVQPSVPRPLAQKTIRPIERIPTGADDLQVLDVPAFKRRGIELNLPNVPIEEDTVREKIDKSDREKPAFLRKVMD